MIPTKNCCFLSKEFSTGKRYLQLELKCEIFPTYVTYGMCMHFLITVIDYGNSKLMGSELELFETLESSRVFKKMEEICINIVLNGSA